MRSSSLCSTYSPVLDHSWMSSASMAVRSTSANPVMTEEPILLEKVSNCFRYAGDASSVAMNRMLATSVLVRPARRGFIASDTREEASMRLTLDAGRPCASPIALRTLGDEVGRDSTITTSEIVPAAWSIPVLSSKV